MSRNKTLHTVIAKQLRESIGEGRIRSGEWLRQDLLAKQFNVSRMPVREALWQLEAEGLVELKPHRGAVVRPLSTKEIEELFRIRVLLEGEAAYHGATKVTPHDIATMRDLIARMKFVNDVSAYLSLNDRFHDTLYRATNARYLLKLVADIRQNVDRYLRIYLATLDHIDHRAIEHERILKACENGDAEAARQTTIEHVEGTTEVLIHTLRRANLID